MRMAEGRREKAVEAFLRLLATKAYQEVGFAEIASAAEMSLAELRGACGSKLELIADLLRDTDKQVLAGIDKELGGEPARERLFDVLMRRIEIYRPHREAIRSLLRSARRDPALALALNQLSLRSQHWMLAAANIDSHGVAGHARAQGLVYVMTRTLQVWVEDDDPGLARTMATLDRELANGERMLNLVSGLCRFVPGFGSRRRRPDFDMRDSAAA
jgi:AcrR family transcriptional regulator